MTRPIESLLIDGQRLDVRVEQLLLPGAEVVRTMTGASSVTTPFHDPAGELRRSGALTRPGAKPLNGFTQAPWRQRIGVTLLTVNGRPFRLAGVSKQGKTLTLTWEGELAGLLRAHERAIRASRADVTRAQFVIRMLREVKERVIHYVVTDPGKHQPIASIDGDDADSKAKRRDRGLSAHARITIAGQTPTREQIRNINTVLGVAVHDESPELAVLGMICANIGESKYETAIVNAKSGAKGVFQVLPRYWHLIDWSDIAGGAEIFLNQGFTHLGSATKKGAIQLARDHGDWTPGQIAAAVEGSDADAAFYDGHLTEARQILAAYGGVERSETVRESFTYRRGGTDGTKEDSWKCTGRLATEVRWNRFESDDVFYFVTDADLFKSQPRMQLSEKTPGVLSIDYDVDVGKPVSQMTVTCRAELWSAPPGSVVEVVDVDDLVDGRWLVDTDRQLLQRADTTIELRRPAPAKPEPAASTHTNTFSDQDTSGIRGEILRVAEKALRLAKNYAYRQVRPIPDSLFPDLARPVGESVPPAQLLIDCSAFVTLVYETAGAPDPNGRGYDGQGNTSTLRAHGTRTNDPQPGDLAHYGTGAAGGASHVTIYIGRENGKDMCIGMGNSGVRKLVVQDVRSDFVGYWTYDLTGT
jgi:hypothetical protein